MRFRFFHFIVFIFLVQGLFAQFPVANHSKVRYEIGSYHDFYREKKTNTSHYIEGDDTIYYCVSINGEQILKNQLNKLKGKNPTLCGDENGNLFACWINALGLVFQRSADYGKTWLPEEKLLTPIHCGFEYNVDDVNFSNNPIIYCDTSENEFKNRIYICWTDTKYSLQDKDVFLMYSDDKGENWTEPILVTYRANHKAQFYPDMTIDQNGFLYLLYYDQQNYASGKSTDITLAVSENGGLKFDYFKVNEKSFMLSENDIFRTCIVPISEIDWIEKNGYYSVLLNDTSFTANNRAFIVKENFLQIPKTISFSKKIIFPIELQDTTTITAVITKPLDPYFEKKVFTEKKFNKGKNEILLDTKKLGLEKGNYTLFLYYNSHNKFVWIVDE